MKKAQGAIEAKPFTRRRGFKFTRHAEAMDSREGRQGISASNWGTGIMANVPNRIDSDRLQWLNWQGLIAYQQSSGMYDERPRLVKRVEDALRGMK